MIEITFPPKVSSLKAEGLTQYDKGQRIEISGTGVTTETVQVHFEVTGKSPTIDVIGVVEGGKITATIPDIALIYGRTLKCYVYVITGDARETKYTVVLPVVSRARPQDYISPAEPPYLTANELNNRIVTAETAVTELSDGLDARYTKTETDGLLGAKANKEQEAWITPTLSNGWTQTENRPIQYMKDDFGFVHIRGTAVNGTWGVPIFGLPQAYRTEFDLTFACLSSNAFAEVQVKTTGGSVVALIGTGGRVSLDGISFRAREA